MLTAYLDESGDSLDTEFVAVAGLMAPEERWQVFRMAWSGILRSAGVTALHMRHFAHFRGQYADWPEARRRELLASLIALIRASGATTVGAVMPMAAWLQLTPGQRRGQHDPYFPCMQEAIYGVALHADLIVQSDAEVVVADQPEFGHQARLMWAGLTERPDMRGRLKRLSYATPDGEPALQAADLVAYELFKAAPQFANPSAQPRWPFAQLMAGDNLLKYLDPDYVKHNAFDIDTIDDWQAPPSRG